MRLLIRQLQTAIAKLGATDFCPHTLSAISFPNNRTETFAPCHLCSLPPLEASLDYSDKRPTPRRLENARAAFKISGEKFPDRSEADRRKVIAEAFGVDGSLL